MLTTPALSQIQSLPSAPDGRSGLALVIDSWPNLAQRGGSSAVGGGPSGYYTQELYADIISYAMSPASRAYLDIQSTPETPLGLHWAGYTDVEHAYSWDPATQVPGITDEDILGVEAPPWTETIQTTADIEYMLFPRLPGIAEIGWLPAGGGWEAYRERLCAHGERWDCMRLHYYPSPRWSGKRRSKSNQACKPTGT